MTNSTTCVKAIKYIPQKADQTHFEKTVKDLA